MTERVGDITGGGGSWVEVKGTCFCTEGRAFVHHNPNKTTQRDQCLVFLWGPLAINLQVPRPFLYYSREEIWYQLCVLFPYNSLMLWDLFRIALNWSYFHVFDCFVCNTHFPLLCSSFSMATSANTSSVSWALDPVCVVDNGATSWDGLPVFSGILFINSPYPKSPINLKSSVS